ncbi:DNA-directed RNA polymerase subunit D [Candidatus Pacearchaeota archaeon]|nr:DNA-directed RNA polymerase subunit D [Candidatus Pacearchaeota archaeon]
MVQKQEKTEKNKAIFVLGTDETLANTIRRSSNEIGIVAIEEVEIHKNDSALYDEILSHRLGLIPLKENRKLNYTEECSCDGKGCNKCQIQLSLKAKGPCMVYSGNFKGDIKIIYEKMPIVLLDKNQELELIAFVRLGKAVTHAKFSPGLVFYRHISDIAVKNADQAEKIFERLKSSILNPPKGKLKNGETYQCSEDMDYIETLIESTENKNKAIEVKQGKEIVFIIESWGQLEPKEIFSESVKVLESNLKEVLKTIKK